MKDKLILLVEDEQNLGLSLCEFLNDEYGKCSWFTNATQAIEFCKTHKVDLALLDIGLPDMSGIELAKILKKDFSHTDFLFLSALNDPEIKVEALEIGGLDYITKPFALKELTFRLDRLFQSQKSLGQSSEEFVFDQISFFPKSFEIIYAGGKKEVLGTKECLILKILLKNQGQVVSREDIIKEVWGDNAFPSNRTVDNYIVKLRRWCDSGNTHQIQSVRGIGYKFCNK